MILRRRSVTAALLALLAACATPDEGDEAPALIVLVTIDQLRGDLIDRYAPAFDGGFRRLVEEGFLFTGASHDHSATSTAIGHATLGTGRYPVNHGITGNSWSERDPDGSLRGVYAVEDPDSPILDHPSSPGRSPRNIRVDGLGDWILAADPEARVLSVSTKDRGAIPTAGRSPAHHVYWWMPSDGTYATSAFYETAYPDWVQRFNRERVPELVADSIWEHTVPEELRELARRDDVAYEADRVNTTFVHRRSDEVVTDALSAQLDWWRATPKPDRATLEFAKAGIEALELGTRGHTDYLAISFSATDYVGHKYGPYSQEQLANLDALDEVLGELFDLLDERVGEGEWVLALSADHGVVTTPEYAAEIGEPGRRLTREERQLFDRTAEEAAAAAFEAGMDTLQARRAIARAVEALPFVADVMVPEDELLRGEPADSFVALFRRSYVTGRLQGLAEWDLPLRYEEGVYTSTFPAGTGHGSPYWYDRWVPIAFLGGSVSAGRSEETVHTVDVAPTLAAIAGASFPADVDGRVLEVTGR